MITRPVIAIAVKEFKEIMRVRLFLSLSFVVPFIMFSVFSFGISLDVENMPFAVMDMDHSQQSAELSEKFDNRFFDLQHRPDTMDEAEALLERGALRGVLIIPPDFSSRIAARKQAELQLLIDGGYPFRALNVKNYAEATIGQLNRSLLDDRALKAGIPPAPKINIQSRYLYNESLKSSNALIPSLLGVILLMNPAILTALAITREKEFGTIYNIYTSQVKRWEFLMGKIIPYLCISAVNFLVLVTAIKFLFQVPMKGSLFALAPSAALYVLITVSIGVLVSSITRTMISAQIVTLIVTLIPAFLYSGLFIPVSSLEGGAKVFAYLLPSMHFITIVRGIYLKGMGFIELLPHTLLLLLYFCVLFTLGVLSFRKREG